MDKLYPIVRRVRRPLLPPDELVSREGAGTCVPANALRAEDEAVTPAEEQSLVTATEKEVSGETPDTTPGTGVLPENVE